MPHHRFGRYALGLAISSIAIACHAEGGTNAGDGGPGTGSLAAGPHWGPCDDVSVPHGEASWRPVECAQLAVPLDWDAPFGPTIAYNIRRIVAKGPSRGQLWMLAGGPGDSDLSMVEIAEHLVVKGLPDFDIYMPDHRGTGRSHYIDCPNHALAPSCLDDLSARDRADLPFFSVTQAAHDVGFAVDVFREGGAPVFVYGVSYGTYLVNRYLSLYPAQPTGAVMDSVVSAHGVPLVDYDDKGNRVARDFLAACGQDRFCSGKVGPDPWDALGRLYDKLATGYCPGVLSHGIEKADLQHFLGDLLSVPGSDQDSRKLVPAVIYRLNRCSASDAAVLAHALSKYVAPDAAAESASEGSSILALNIGISEGWGAPPLPSLSEMEAEENGYYFSRGRSLPFLQVIDAWTLPRDSVDPSLKQWAQTDVPVLLLDGTLDTMTPLSLLSDAPAHFSKPHQHFVAIDNSGHCNIQAADAPPSPGQEAYDNCGFELIAHFVRDPTAPLDTSCAKAPPIDFSTGLVGPSREWFGVDDPYDGEPDSPSRP